MKIKVGAWGQRPKVGGQALGPPWLTTSAGHGVERVTGRGQGLYDMSLVAAQIMMDDKKEELRAGIGRLPICLEADVLRKPEQGVWFVILGMRVKV